MALKSPTLCPVSYTHLCNAAGRFLIKRTNEKIAGIVSEMFGLYSEEKYANRLNDLLTAVVEHVEGNPELRQTETEDMFDHYDKYEDADDYSTNSYQLLSNSFS